MTQTGFRKYLQTAIIILLVFVFAECSEQSGDFKLPKENLMAGLASPVMLNPDTTVVHIADYFPTEPAIDSVTATEGLKITQKDTIIELIVQGAGFPRIGQLHFYISGDRYDILLKRSSKIKYEFTFKTDEPYEKVQLKGTFNAWNPANTNLTKKDGVWTTTLLLEPGEYQYLIVADGKEMLDPANDEKISNNMGGFNSLLKVGQYTNLEKPHLFAKSTTNGSVIVDIENSIDNLIVFAQNKTLPETYIHQDIEEIQITIPKETGNLERSYLRIQATNDDGLSNFLKIPLHKGKVLQNAENLKRTDFEAATIYNVFIDRFNDANPENTWKIEDEAILPKANYFGGDLEGVIEKIEDGYFENLGINTIWISPVIKNPEGAYGLFPDPKTKFSGYHGYWPVSFTQLNPHFGTEEELKKLVDLAHKNNLNVLLDFVANHVHENHPIIQANPDWKTNLYLPDGTENTRLWDEQRLTTWFDTFMPTLDLENPEVTNMLTDSAVYWIKKYNFDGFRHDATKHVPEIFWRTLTQKLRNEVVIPENRRLYQIGETYGSAELIGSYVNSGQLSAQFDFNVYDVIVGTLAGDRSFSELEAEIKRSQKYYGSHHLMGNITGNQDRARFISYASGALRFDEDAQKAGWTREIKVEDTVGYQKAAMLNAIISTLPGLPVIYYGDEIGMPGGNDPDNRRMMRFEDLAKPEQKMREITSKLLNFRQKALPLIFGDMQFVKVSENLLIFQRTYLNEAVIIALNDSDTKAEISIKTPAHIASEKFAALFNKSIKKDDKSITVSIPAYDFVVLSNIK